MVIGHCRKEAAASVVAATVLLPCTHTCTHTDYFIDYWSVCNDANLAEEWIPMNSSVQVYNLQAHSMHVTQV